MALQEVNSIFDPSGSPHLQFSRLCIASQQVQQAQTKITDLLERFSEEVGEICGLLITDFEGAPGAIPDRHRAVDLGEEQLPAPIVAPPRRAPAGLAAAAAGPAQIPAAPQETDSLAAFRAQHPGGTNLLGAGYEGYSASYRRTSRFSHITSASSTGPNLFGFRF